MRSPALDGSAARAPARERVAPGLAGRAPFGLAERRSFTALLRERARRLSRSLPPRLAEAAQLLPILLHASFDLHALQADAPGVAGLSYQRRWTFLARDFGLPPPCRVQRGPTLVDAVVVISSGAELHALAIVPPSITAEQRGAIEARLESLQRVLTEGGAPTRASLVDPGGQAARDPELAHRLGAFGALVAGSLSPEAWEMLEAARTPLPPLTTSALAASAPTPLATLALTLMTRKPCPAPLDAAVALLQPGTAARHLADHETFCIRWAGLAPGLRELLDETLRLTGSESPARKTEYLQDLPEVDVDVELDFDGPPPAEPSVRRTGARPPPTSILSRVVSHGRALAHACALAIRGSRMGRLDRFTERLWRHAVGPGMPRVLLPALGALLAEEAAAGRLTLDPTRAGHAYEVRLPDGTVLGRGAGPVQARVRALGLVAAAEAARTRAPRPDGADSLFSGLDATWREVGRQLGRAREVPTLMVLVVSGGGARPGPPMDLLNRGPERALEFDGAVAVLVMPGRRPTGSMLAPEQAVQAVLRRAPAGASLELLAAHSAARPVAARLARITGLLRDPSLTGPVAVEAGGHVLLVQDHGLRVYPLDRFAARPRIFTPDPDAPDISVCTGERQRVRSRTAGVVQCRAMALDARRAALLYADGAGAHLREEVALSELEERLRDAREIVRGATPPAALMVRLADDLELAVRRAGPPGSRVEIAVGGALPFVELQLDGERFGGASALGWSAAAEALLSRWPAGGEGLVGVSAVTATTSSGALLPPLLALYASSVARRRLRTHLVRAVASYRTASESRKAD